MKRHIVVAVIILATVQIIGYFTLSQQILISKLISETKISIDIIDYTNITINHNCKLSDYNDKNFHNLFQGRVVQYSKFKNDADLDNLLFIENNLAFTLYIKRFKFPVAIVWKSETSLGYSSDEENLYAWIFIKWIKIKELSRGQT